MEHTPATPAVACTGATRERLGDAACVPVGDCNAPFPPAGALLVDDDFTAAQIDATHFRSVGAALAAAPAGGVVAVDAGRYEDVVIDASAGAGVFVEASHQGRQRRHPAPAGPTEVRRA